MHLFILDFGGTLDRISDPTAFVLALKARHPKCVVVLHTGTEKDVFQERHPALLTTVDDLWQKPCNLPEKCTALAPDQITLADDDDSMRRAVARVFRLAKRDIRILEAEALPGLLLE